MNQPSSGLATRTLSVTTLAFTICFAVWMINGVLVTFLVNNGIYKWSPVQVGWLLGVPVLVGSVLRLPVGILTDKLGGRWVMGSLLMLCAVPVYLLSYADDYTSFLALSFCFGIAGSTFASGVAYVSLFFPKNKQGTALGIFGVGNMGAALTTLFGPTLLEYVTDHGANLAAWRSMPRLYAALLAATGIVFFLLTKNARPTAVKSMRDRLLPLREARVWRFGLYYFVVFGSFVALSQWLIPYYVNVYSMPIVMAGFMTTAFNLPSGVIRAVGGVLADKIGARMLLYVVFGVCIVCLFLLFFPRMEINAPGQGIMATRAGTVTAVSDNEIQIGDTRYAIQHKGDTDKNIKIRFGIHHDTEGFLILPTASTWQTPLVKAGDTVTKGQLIAKGNTQIYFQANVWIFTALVFIIGLMMGLGSAAVFKHIPTYYPNDIGSVGGIVGVLGGLGGFIDPIVFGYLLSATGVWTTSWMMLAGLSIISIALMHFAISRSKVGVYTVPDEAIKQIKS